VKTYLDSLAGGDSGLVGLRLAFLWRLIHYEHYVPLNLPLAFTITKGTSLASPFQYVIPHRPFSLRLVFTRCDVLHMLIRPEGQHAVANLYLMELQRLYSINSPVAAGDRIHRMEVSFSSS